MYKMRKIFSVLLLSVVVSSASAKPLPKDPAVREGRLVNGLIYFIRHNDQTPGQADFYIAQRVGSILEQPEQRGLAHFLEHMAFNGTENFPDGNGGQRAIRQWCERNGIKFGADLNAYTSIDETVYNISNAPVTKQGVSDTCLLILHDWSHSLLLRGEEIDQERGVIREEWRTRRAGQAVQRMMEDATPVIYAGSKYEDCLPIGHIEVVDTFHHEVLRDYYKKWYRPDLQAIIVVGDINVDEIEDKIRQTFADIPAPAADAAERIYYTIGDNKDMIVFNRADDEQPTVNFTLMMKRQAGARSDKATYEAFADDYKSRLAMFVLRQRLSELTKEEHPRVMSASCRDGAFYYTDAAEAFTVNIGLLPDRPQQGIDAVMEIVEKARLYGVTPTEFEHAKEQYNVNLEHRLDNKDKTRNGEYVNKLVGHFCSAEHLMSIEQEGDIEHALMESVTIDDVNAKLREVIHAPNGGYNEVCMVYGPTKWNGQPYTMPTDSQFKQWILDAEKRQYDNDIVDKPIDRTFIKKLPKKGKILSCEDAGHGYTKYVLSNGINVYARPSELEPNRLTINMSRLGGESLYDDKDIPSLHYLGSVIKQSGAADFDYLTLEKKRMGKALRVTPFVSDETEGVSGVCAASDFKTWLEVAYLYLTKPRRDDKVFSSLMERQRSVLRNRTASPKVIYNDSLRATVYGKTERTEPMTEERLALVSHDRIHEIYRERFANLAGMNLVVTGAIREDEFEDLICQYVASLPGKPAKAWNAVGKHCQDIQRGQRLVEFEQEQKTPSALTNVIYTADVEYNLANELRADMLAQIMRAIYTEKVREEKGGTYGVSVQSQNWRFPSDGTSLTVNFRCDPDKYSELLPIIDEQMRLMAAQGPTEEQLQKVKEYEQKNYDRVILTNGYWEYIMLHRLRYGVDLDEQYMQMVNNTTPADIRDICKRFVDSGNRIQVTMKSPADK